MICFFLFIKGSKHWLSQPQYTNWHDHSKNLWYASCPHKYLSNSPIHLPWKHGSNDGRFEILHCFQNAENHLNWQHLRNFYDCFQHYLDLRILHFYWIPKGHCHHLWTRHELPALLQMTLGLKIQFKVIRKSSGVISRLSMKPKWICL